MYSGGGYILWYMGGGRVGVKVQFNSDTVSILQ